MKLTPVIRLPASRGRGPRRRGSAPHRDRGATGIPALRGNRSRAGHRLCCHEACSFWFGRPSRGMRGGSSRCLAARAAIGSPAPLPPPFRSRAVISILLAGQRGGGGPTPVPETSRRDARIRRREAGRLRRRSGTAGTRMSRGPRERPAARAWGPDRSPHEPGPTERFREPGGPLRIVEPGVSGQEVLPPGGEGGAARQNGRQPGLGDEQRAGHGLEVAGIGSQKALGRGGGGPVIDPLGTSGASDLAAQSSQPPGRDQPSPRRAPAGVADVMTMTGAR